MNEIFIGIVKDGKFMRLIPNPETPGEVRLTSHGMDVGVPPEHGELDLTEHEGKAIAIRGHDGGDWVYSAGIIDIGGPIETALVEHVFK